MELTRLPLEGATNTRDIGGYVTNDKKVVKWKTVLRSDDMSRLTEEDQQFLLQKYKLKKILDLRSPKECEHNQNVFIDNDKVEYINISLANDVDPNSPNVPDFDENFLTNFYIDLIDNKQENIRTVLEEIANIENGSVIFHCTAGKDRTGVIAMLILGVCGVNKQDITTNYMQSQTNLKYNENFVKGMEKMKVVYGDSYDSEVVKKIVASNEQYIEDTYDHLINEYQSFNNYFLHIGFSQNEIDTFISDVTEVL